MFIHTVLYNLCKGSKTHGFFASLTGFAFENILKVF
jgi:hypothetical protein